MKIKILSRLYLDWSETTIEDLKQDIESLEKEGITHITNQEENGFAVINAYCEREETEQEMKDRIFREECRAEQIKKRDLQKLQELKAKYE